MKSRSKGRFSFRRVKGEDESRREIEIGVRSRGPKQQRKLSMLLNFAVCNKVYHNNQNRYPMVLYGVVYRSFGVFIEACNFGFSFGYESSARWLACIFSSA